METTEKVVHRPGNNKKTIENKKKPIFNKKILIAIVGGYLQINPASIVKCETVDHQVFIHLDDNPTILRATKSLEEICERFAAYDFLRISKSCVINANQILTYLREGGGTIVLSNGCIEYLSDTYRQSLMDWVKKKELEA